MNAVEIYGLKKSRSGFTLDIDRLVLPSGCILGLVGENGAGKSTTIKLILGMLKRSEGTVTLLGRDNEPIEVTKQDIGVVLDEVGLPQALNPVQIGRVMAGVFHQWDAELYDQYLERFDVPRDKKFKTFSRGMKMKLGLIIALSHHPRLLLLDEATSGLDPVVRDEILDLFLEFTRDEEHSILISSHIVTDLEKLCDYVAFLHKGKILLYEEKDRLMEDYRIVRTSPEELMKLPKDAILGQRKSPYGVEAFVHRDALPAHMEAGPVDLEQLFVYMVKKEA